MCVHVYERERERKRKISRGRERERDSDRQTETDRKTERPGIVVKEKKARTSRSFASVSKITKHIKF